MTDQQLPEREQGPLTHERLADDAPPGSSHEARTRRGVAGIIRLAIIPTAAIILALLAGAVIIGVSSFFAGGFDPLLPLNAYLALASGAFGSADGFVNTLAAAAPLVLGGLAVGIGFKAGLFNIGATGQFLMGGLASAVVGSSLAEAPGPIAITLAILAGALAGALWGFIPGILKALTGAHEVVTTIMLNFIATYLLAVLVSRFFAAEQFSFSRTGDLGAAELPILIGRTGHLGLIIALAAVPAAWWLLWRSTLGFEIRTVGANPDAARYAGMHPRFIIALTMSLCGMLAGLAGAGNILGITGFMSSSYATSIGFDSIAVALLGRAHPFGILFAGLLFGAMRAGAPLMQIRTGIPIEIIDVIQAVILLFLAADIIVRRLIRVRAAGAGVDEMQTVSRSYGGKASV